MVMGAAISGPGQPGSNIEWQATAYDINAPDNLGIADINYQCR